MSRPQILDGETLVAKTGCGNAYITINKKETGVIQEVFIHLGKAGGCASAQNECIGRLVSLALRNGILLVDVVKHNFFATHR